MIADVTTFLQAIPVTLLRHVSNVWLYTIGCAAKEELWPELERIALTRQNPMLAAVLLNRIDQSVESQQTLANAIINIKDKAPATQALLKVLVGGTGVKLETLQRSLQWYTRQPITHNITVAELDESFHCLTGIPRHSGWEETADEASRLQWYQLHRTTVVSGWGKTAGHTGSPRFTVPRLCEIVVAVVARDVSYYCESALVWDPEAETDLSREVEQQLAELNVDQWLRLLERLTLGPGDVTVGGDWVIGRELNGVTAV